MWKASFGVRISRYSLVWCRPLCFVSRIYIFLFLFVFCRHEFHVPATVSLLSSNVRMVIMLNEQFLYHDFNVLKYHLLHLSTIYW